MDLTLPAVVIRYSARTSAAVPKTVVGLGGIPPLVKSADLTYACAFNERMLGALNAHACVKFFSCLNNGPIDFFSIFILLVPILFSKT